MGAENIPGTPEITRSNIMGYFFRIQHPLGDFMGSQGDRELYGPLMATFVHAQAKTVPGWGTTGRELIPTEYLETALSQLYAERREDPQAYRQARDTLTAIALEMGSNQPEVIVAQNIEKELAGTEAEILAHDILAGIGAVYKQRAAGHAGEIAAQAQAADSVDAAPGVDVA